MTEESYQHRTPPNFDQEKQPEAPPAPQLGRAVDAAPPAASTGAEPTVAGPGAVAPTPPAQRAPKPASPPEAPLEPVHWAYYVVLVGIAALGLYLRLRDPLSSPIIGAEDPYLHMERTHNLVQGEWVRDYPIGFMILLAPFALFGPDVLYTVARFGPALLGMASIVLMFFLCRRYLHPAGSLTAALLMAVMPEQIVRTNLLFPTALDLAALPFLFYAVLRLAEGRRWAVPTLLSMTLALLLIHPWVVALMVPPLLVFGLVAVLMRREKKAVVASGGVAGMLAGVAFLGFANGWSLQSVGALVRPKVLALAADPTLLFTMPVFVDLEWMLGWPAMVLGALGAVLAVVRHTRFHLLFLIWSAMLLPLVLVDWFDVWYIPHRTVVYLSLGVAVLGGITISEIMRSLQSVKPSARVGIMLGALGGMLIITLPSAMALEPWYRQYDNDDLAAWQALDERDTEFVMAGSWQARAGYRATTARDALFNPDFFSDTNIRAIELKKNPDLVVLVDRWTYKDGRDTSFLNDTAEWSVVGRWDDVTAYERA